MLNLVQVSEKLLSHPEPRKALRQVLQCWLPLSEAVLGMVMTHLPDPAAAARERVKRLLPSHAADLPPETQKVGGSAQPGVADFRNGLSASLGTC